MSQTLGSGSNPIRVAVIGAGPAGFYTADALLKSESPMVTVDLFDHLPTPYGLVRGGVAPDHQKIKTVTKVYEKTAAHPGFRFMGNVTFGRDMGLEDLLARYHQVVFCTGAQKDRQLGVAGEDLPGSYPATDFVAWYNGHPDYTGHTFNLDTERVAVIGNGNVAMDVVRILTAPIHELQKTDIADYALDALKQSKVRQVVMVGRRGPAQAAFTNPEIRELTELEGVDLVLRPEDFDLDPCSLEFLESASNPVHQRNVNIMREHLQKTAGANLTADRQIQMLFFFSPVELKGAGKVESLVLEKNRLEKDEKGNVRAKGTGLQEILNVGTVFRSIGYLGEALPGVPFNPQWGVIPNKTGRVLTSEGGQVIPRLYTAGWIKRGPSGVIGTNKACAVETVRAMLDDFQSGALNHTELPEGSDILGFLSGKGVRVVSFSDWKKLDAEEVSRGQAEGRPRKKLTRVEEMLALL